MSALDRALGLARSLAIYHAIPLRQRRLRGLYRRFVGPGDLAFDVGAHAGNRSRALAALGCRVVALEPQPDFARLLRWGFRGNPRVVVRAQAVGAARGHARMAISERTPTVTTIAEAWRSARAREPDFAHVRWAGAAEVEVVTLDLLIAGHGAPRFVKIDVEGGESAVLAGLSQAVPFLSFEYLPRALDQVEACVRRLGELAPYRFNWSPGESFALAAPAWIDGEHLLRALAAPAAQRGSGDVYAQLASTS